MIRKSKTAVWLRNRKCFYGSYLSIANTLNRFDTKQLSAFLLFLGYPRSGSSTLGSILDAHANIIVAHELNVLDYISKKYNKKQLFYLIRKNSKLFTKNDRVSSGYKGAVAGQKHSEAAQLNIIGDKKAGKTTHLLENYPELIAQLGATVNLPLKFIHIVRNPFDMITTQARGGNERQYPVTTESIRAATEFCFRKIETVNRLIKSGNLDIHTLQYENLLEYPKTELSALLNWLGIDASDDYLEACSNHLYKSPHRSRLKYNWTEQEKQWVLNKIKDIDFLREYDFDN
jgi:hypothetical protein